MHNLVINPNIFQNNIQQHITKDPMSYKSGQLGTGTRSGFRLLGLGGSTRTVVLIRTIFTARASITDQDLGNAHLN